MGYRGLDEFVIWFHLRLTPLAAQGAYRRSKNPWVCARAHTGAMLQGNVAQARSWVTCPAFHSAFAGARTPRTVEHERDAMPIWLYVELKNLRLLRNLTNGIH